MYRIIDTKCAFSITYTRGILGNSGAYDSNWNKVTNTIFSHSHREENAYFKRKLCITSNGLEEYFQSAAGVDTFNVAALKKTVKWSYKSERRDF